MESSSIWSWMDHQHCGDPISGRALTAGRSRFLQLLVLVLPPSMFTCETVQTKSWWNVKGPSRATTSKGYLIAGPWKYAMWNRAMTKWPVLIAGASNVCSRSFKILSGLLGRDGNGGTRLHFRNLLASRTCQVVPGDSVSYPKPARAPMGFPATRMACSHMDGVRSPQTNLGRVLPCYVSLTTCFWFLHDFGTKSRFSFRILILQTTSFCMFISAFSWVKENMEKSGPTLQLISYPCWNFFPFPKFWRRP